MIRIAIDTDENADWIKTGHGGETNREELAIHDKLAENDDKAQAKPKSEPPPETAQEK